MRSFEELLTDLVRTPGVSGFEDAIREVIVGELNPYADDLRIDKFGNILATKRKEKNGRKGMFAAHMDEIGFIVKFVGKGGFIRFAPLGSWSPRVLLGQRVIVHTKSNGDVSGVIGAKPPHLMSQEDKKKPIDFSHLFTDVGAEGLGVEIGDSVTVDRELKVMPEWSTYLVDTFIRPWKWQTRMMP